jgi:hypothetical protein
MKIKILMHVLLIGAVCLMTDCARRTIIVTHDAAEGTVGERDMEISLNAPNTPPPAETQPSAALVQNKPKVAVYIADGGQGRGIGELLRTYMLEGLVNSDMYVAIERSEEFLKQLHNEHFKQRSGDVDDSQISRLGKQAGVDVVCVVKVAPGIGDYQLSARMIDVETAKIMRIGVTNSSLRSTDNMTKAANELVGKILGANAPAGKFVSGVARASEQSANSAASQPSATQPHYSNQQQNAAQQNNSALASIFIGTLPSNADVYIGNRLIGKSNTMLQIPVGVHQMMFVKDRVAKTVTIEVKPGSNPSKFIPLK